MRMKDKILIGLAGITRKYPIRGIETLLRYIYHPDKRRLDNFSTIISYDCGALQINTASFIEWYTLFKGYYEPAVTTFIQSIVKDEFISIDVGANIGIHTITMSRGNHVIAVEPNPRIAQRLLENIKLSKIENVTVKQCALSNTCGDVDFYCVDTSYSHQGISSCYKKHPSALMKKISVPVQSLDSIGEKLQRLDFIKIDVEGHDFNVLLGSVAMIKKFRPIILFEWCRQDWALAGYTLEDAVEFFNTHRYSLGILNRQFHKNSKVDPIEEAGDFEEIIAKAF